MTQFVGVIHSVSDRSTKVPGLSPGVKPPERWDAVETHDGDFLESLQPPMRAGEYVRGTRTAERRRAWGGAVQAQPGDDFFEKIIVRPRRNDFGILLANQSSTIRIYNSYRHENRVFQSFTNTAGAGISITDLPTLPFILGYQRGISLSLLVTSEGPSTIDGTLDFEFDTVTISIPITGQRVIVFPFQPTQPLTERLQFRTDVLRMVNGTEQRRSIRMSPRQTFDVNLYLEGQARRLYDTLVFDVHSRQVAVPVWFEPSIVKVKVTPGDTVVQVDSTAYADLRVGSMAIVWNSETLYETLEVFAINPTSVEFTSPFNRAFPRNSQLMPVRIAVPTGDLRGDKYPLNLQSARVVLQVTDNDVDLSDASAFGTYDSKVLLDDPNTADPTSSEAWVRQAFEYDGETGQFIITSESPNATRGYQRTFVCDSRQKLWELRQLLHFLRGRQVSFWAPSNFEELTIVSDVSSGSQVVDVENVGYSKFVRGRRPRNVINVRLQDGSSFTQVIESAEEISETVERLTIVGSWSNDFPTEDVTRVQFYEKVRLDQDEIQIRHLSGRGDAIVSVPVIGVYE